MGEMVCQPALQIVPIEPTAAMLAASWTATVRGAQEDPVQFQNLTWRQKHELKMKRRWAAMMKAAPGPYATTLLVALAERDALRIENAHLRAALSKAEGRSLSSASGQEADHG